MMRLHWSKRLRGDKGQSFKGLSLTKTLLLQFFLWTQKHATLQSHTFICSCFTILLWGSNFPLHPLFFTMPSKHKADLSYHCAWSEFYLELHMLLQPTLKAWCWCLASLGPLTIKRGAILSPHCLLWAVEVKRQKCEIMNECLAVYLSFPSTQLDWESAPDAIQASILKEKKGGYFVCWSGPIKKRGMFLFSNEWQTDF